MGHSDINPETIVIINLKKEIDMSEITIEMAASEEVVTTALRRLSNREIGDAIAFFAEEFTFKDYGIGLEFNSKDRLG